MNHDWEIGHSNRLKIKKHCLHFIDTRGVKFPVAALPVMLLRPYVANQWITIFDVLVLG